MRDKDCSHRDIVDKLGVKSGHTLAFDEGSRLLDPNLKCRVLERAGISSATQVEEVDVVLAVADASTDVVALLEKWKGRLRSSGGIWLLSPKRGTAGYVNQRKLIAAGLAAGLVDNKSCSVSNTTSGIRFVIRKTDRPLRK